MIKKIIKNIFKIKTPPKKVFSYGEFLQKNPNATKKQRQKAIKKFYESTR